MADAALTARLREAAKVIADDAQARAALFSETIPPSVRLQGGTRSVTIAAGGSAAPSAYTWEGKRSGRPRYHPVYARGPRDEWTWAPQLPVRPFLEEALDSKQEQMVAVFAQVIDDWAHEKGFK